MAAGGQSIYDYQRAMMEAEVRDQRRRVTAMRNGQDGPRRPGAGQNGVRHIGAGRPSADQNGVRHIGAGRRESFDPHRFAPADPPSRLGGPYGSGYPAGVSRPDRSLDVHEILKHQAFASESASCDDHFEKNRPCPSAVYGVSDQYVVLDSFEKVRESNQSRGELKFNFMVQGVTRNQAIGVVDKIDTVIGVQACDFCIPMLSLDTFDPATLTTLNPTLAVLNLAANGALPMTGDNVTNARSQTPYCTRVIMYLKEIGLQSFSDADNRRHHFEFNATVVGNAPVGSDGDRILLTPLRDCEYYIFTDPIQDIHGLTVCFYNPGNPIKFPPDCLYGTLARSDAGQLLEFTYVDETNLINLAIGDRIFIRGFNSGNQILDTYIGRPEGHLVGNGGFSVVGPTGPGTFTTVTFRLNPDVDVSAYYGANTAIASSTEIIVCIAKNRIRIPLRFRRVVDRLTQYIAP